MQAVALVEARGTIVQGAVDIAYQAVLVGELRFWFLFNFAVFGISLFAQTLKQRGIEMDDEQKVELVTNLLMVTVSNHDNAPTVTQSKNTGGRR